ncbi:MAG: MFS transporter [Acidimicrobiia bacterium]|nr:MFS transporter [Acidimicrobiia bacterium]
MTDASTGTATSSTEAGPSFEWWMLSNFAVGAGFSAFIALLIPPYVTETTDDVTASGVVMAVISLGAVLGPVLGSFADKYRAHRAVMCGGILGMGLGFALFAGAAESSALFALDAIILGVSVAAISAVAPVFVVGAGLSQGLEAKRMTYYSLMMPAGQVVGGVLTTAAVQAEWSFSNRFWLAAVVSALLFLAVLATSSGPEKRVHRVMDEAAPSYDDAADGGKIGLSAVLWSAFGVFLLVSTLTSVANNGINNQISNILPNVYGISESGTSTLIAVAGLLNIVLFFPAGRWMARSGAPAVYNAGLILRLGGALGMALVGWLASSAVIVAIACMQLLYQGSPFARLAQPSTAVGFATFPAGAANGWLIGCSALGSFLGSVLGGVFADRWGFNSVNWMAAAAAAGSVLIALLFLLPKTRSKDADAAAEPVPGAAAKAATA